MSAETVAAPPRQYNFAAALFEANASRPRKLAYIDDAQTLTYGALETLAKQFAQALYGLGLRREERILLVLLDTIDLPIAFLGALYAGVVPVVVNTLLPAVDYAFMLEHSGARAVVVSGSLAPKLTTAIATAGDDYTAIPSVVSQPEAAGTAYYQNRRLSPATCHICEVCAEERPRGPRHRRQRSADARSAGPSAGVEGARE